MKVIAILYLALTIVGCGAAFYGAVCFLSLLIIGEVFAAFKVLAIVGMDVLISCISARNYVSRKEVSSEVS